MNGLTGILPYAFGAILALLVVASGITLVLRWQQPARDYTALWQRICTWWGLAALLFVSLSWRPVVAVVVLAVLSGLAFREFLTLVPGRASDRGARQLAYLAIPGQYLWAGLGWHGLFLTFIPVGMLLLLALRLVAGGHTLGFVRAAATLHWGLLLTTFSLSYVAALLVLPPQAGPHGAVRGEQLVFFLLVLTQLNDVAQYLWGKALGKLPVAPQVSPGKTVEGLLGGLATTTLLAGVLGPWLTPLSPLLSALAGGLIGLGGFGGDLVVSAVKRDAGVKDTGALLPGHGGILDRLDSLTYTAPLFFYYVQHWCY